MVSRRQYVSAVLEAGRAGCISREAGRHTKAAQVIVMRFPARLKSMLLLLLPTITIQLLCCLRTC